MLCFGKVQTCSVAWPTPTSQYITVDMMASLLAAGHYLQGYKVREHSARL